MGNLSLSPPPRWWTTNHLWQGRCRVYWLLACLLACWEGRKELLFVVFVVEDTFFVLSSFGESNKKLFWSHWTKTLQWHFPPWYKATLYSKQSVESGGSPSIKLAKANWNEYYFQRHNMEKVFHEKRTKDTKKLKNLVLFNSSPLPLASQKREKAQSFRRI